MRADQHSRRRSPDPPARRFAASESDRSTSASLAASIGRLIAVTATAALFATPALAAGPPSDPAPAPNRPGTRLRRPAPALTRRDGFVSLPLRMTGVADSDGQSQPEQALSAPASGHGRTAADTACRNFSNRPLASGGISGETVSRYRGNEPPRRRDRPRGDAHRGPLESFDPTPARCWGACTKKSRFLKARPHLAQRMRTDNQCRIAADELVDALVRCDIAATPVWVRGHRTPPRDPAPRAMSADRHRLVRLPDGTFVDVTRRQFYSCAQHPTF
jgi:hypothetical protein